MLKKDFVLNFILNKYSEDYSAENISEIIDISEKALWLIEKVLNTNQKWGQSMTFLDVIDLYTEGFTFSEIAWIKGVTKEAIRLTVRTSIRTDYETLKKSSRKKRNALRDNILYNGTVTELKNSDFETAVRKSGYSESAFKIKYKEALNKERSSAIIDSENLIDLEGDTE